MGVTSDHAVVTAPSSADDRARQFIRALLTGDTPSSKDLNSLGRWSEEVAALFDVMEHGGNVKQAFDALCNANSALIELVSTDGDNWPDPEELVCSLPPVMPFHETLLPDAFRPWVMDITDRMQVPPDFLAIGVMVSFAAAVGRRATICPKRHDDWVVVPNLWGGVVGRPGLLKSPALEEAMRPLKRLEANAARNYDEAIAQYEKDAFIYEAHRNEAKSRLRHAEHEEHQQILDELSSLEPSEPNYRRHIVNDATIEKLGEILQQNPEGVLLYRDELLGFLRSFDKQGHETDRAFFLEAWRGDGDFTSDRIGRGTTRIEHICVSVLGSIQPGPLTSYVRDAFQSGTGADGLLQRFQLLIWPDVPSEYHYVDKLPNSEAANIALRAFQCISERSSNSLPLRFSPEAQSIFDNWLVRHERRLRSDDAEHDAMLAHLSKYRSLVPSLALLYELASDNTHTISSHAVQAATRWCTYLESHARRIYSSGVDYDTAPITLSKRLARADINDGFTARDVIRKRWVGLTDDTIVSRALLTLCQTGWIRPSTKFQTKGRPTKRYEINPKVFI